MPVLVEAPVYEDPQGVPHLDDPLSVANDNGNTVWALKIAKPIGWKEATAALYSEQRYFGARHALPSFCDCWIG
jgi:hypothetical protein